MEEEIYTPFENCGWNKACVSGKHELFKSEEIWLFCPICGKRLWCQ